MKRMSWIFSLAVVLLLSAWGCSQAPSSGPGRMVDTVWLATHLDDPDLVLLHVGDPAGYAQEHLPGARLIERNDLADPASVERGAEPYLEMPSPARLDSVLESMGISDGSRIVVYWGSDWVTPATRIVLALDYIGLKGRTHVLDGGMPAWKAAGRPTTPEVPGPASPGSVTPHPDPDLIVDDAWVAAHLEDPGIRIIDCRDTVYFTADPARPDPMSGHLPGAVNIPFGEIVTEDLHLKPAADLRALFTAAGVEEGEQVVTYCHIGQQASLVRLAADLLGIPVRFYDGSFRDWIAHGHPVEGGNGGH